MKNRAKCKLCNTIITTLNTLDEFSCPCGELTIDCISGEFHAKVKSDIDNLILVDDEGNEIIPKFAHIELEMSVPNSRKEILLTLDAMIASIDSLPPSARQSPITHSDFSAALSLIATLFRAS